MNPGPEVTRVHAVVPAAGVGRRMGDGLARPKQYRTIQGFCVLVWTLGRLLAEPRVARIHVAVDPDDPYRHEAERQIHRHDPRAADRINWVCGGVTRQDSVLSALRSLASEPGYDPGGPVLVHDAVRPCLTGPALAGLIEAAVGHAEGAVLGIPVRDTLKAAQGPMAAARIEDTVPREGLWHAQTPQAFPAGRLIEALEAAGRDGRTVTDEAQAVEALGVRPCLVAGALTNLKITHAADLEFAAALLAGRVPGDG